MYTLEPKKGTIKVRRLIIFWTLINRLSLQSTFDFMSIVEPKNALSTLYGTKPRRQTKKEFNQISDSPLFMSCFKNFQPQDWTSIQ